VLRAETIEPLPERRPVGAGAAPRMSSE
jgi:hypothetical protein